MLGLYGKSEEGQCTALFETGSKLIKSFPYRTHNIIITNNSHKVYNRRAIDLRVAVGKAPYSVVLWDVFLFLFGMNNLATFSVAQY